MTAICTNTEVYDFMGTGESERGSSADMITDLIDRVQFEIEQIIGRKVTAQTITSLKVHDGHYADINGNLCFLNGQYYDIAKITLLKDNGVTLTENTDFVIRTPNCIERIDAYWTNESLGLELTGVFGLVYNTGTNVTPIWTPLPDIKQIVIEAVAIKSGLWSKNIEDGEGNAMTIVRQNLSKATIERLNAYRQPVL